MFQLQLFFLLDCYEWDRVVALPRHKFVTGATLLQLPRAHQDLLGALSGPQNPRCKLCLHFILYLATPLMNIKTFLFLLVHIQRIVRVKRSPRVLLSNKY